MRTQYPFLQDVPNPTLSFEVGVIKPSPEIYLMAARNLDRLPEQCLFIDDLDKNVKGAQAVGMEAVKFQSASQIRECLQHRGIL